MRSKLAVWSFVLSLVPIVLFLIIILIGWTDKNMTGEDMWGLAMFWAFFSVLISLVSLILSLVSLYKINKYRLNGKGFAIAGFVISLILSIYFIGGSLYPLLI